MLTFEKADIIFREPALDIFSGQRYIRKALNRLFAFADKHTKENGFLTCTDCEEDEGTSIAAADTLCHTQSLHSSHNSTLHCIECHTITTQLCNAQYHLECTTQPAQSLTLQPLYISVNGQPVKKKFDTEFSKDQQQHGRPSTNKPRNPRSLKLFSHTLRMDSQGC